MAKFELISRDTPLKPDDPVTVVRQQDLADRTLPQFRDLSESADKYYADDDLLLVINMALHTGAPLLLTGEPGTGKTQAAEFIRRYFGIPLFKFFVKSTSMAQDLMYEFDAVGYLHWAQSDKKTLQGDALTQETEAIRENFLHQRALWQAYDHEGDCVVLIDEIDKAPRDFPNDLLHEFDQHHFPHPFDPKNTIKPKSKRPPIIVITSNDERRLPDAFLRRCIFHRIELTEPIVNAAIANMANQNNSHFPQLVPEVLEAAKERFWKLRKLKPALEKKPSTAELLTWLSILSALNKNASDISDCRWKDLPAHAALIKDRADIERLDNM